MEQSNMTFGEFIVHKRKILGMQAKQVAFELGISSVYMCDIEKNRKSSVSKEFLEALILLLRLTEAEAEEMYDLLAIAQNSISADLPEYIMNNQSARMAIRTAKKNNIPNEQWDNFADKIKAGEY